MTQFTAINYIKTNISQSHFDALCISLAEVGAVNGVVIAVERHCLFMQPPSLRISVSAQGLKKMQWAMHCAKMAVKKYQQKTNQNNK